jgi:tetratricopeptide (TPR) repeat protein
MLCRLPDILYHAGHSPQRKTCWQALARGCLDFPNPLRLWRDQFFRESHVTNTNAAVRVETRGGSFDQGLANGYRLLDQHPDVALHQAQTLLRAGPETRAFQLAAEALRRLGKPVEAEQAELSGIGASFSIRQLDDAAVAGSEGRGAQSRSLLEAFLDEHPDNLLALTMAAELDIEEWRLERADERLRAVLNRAPNFLRAIMLLGRSLTAQARLGEAIALYQGVLARKPNNPIALRSLAEAHGEANQHDKAAETYRRLLDLDGSQLDLWIIYAQELRMMARKEESVAAFRRALAIDPNSGAAWWGLAYYFPSEITDDDLAAMERALANVTDSPQEGGPLHVALGVMAERRGDYAEAFSHISRGKQLRASGQPRDPSQDTAHLDEVIAALTPERVAALAGGGSPDDAPIFIIGMPRSGTTLLERILSCHSRIEAGGELPIIARMASAGAGSSGANIQSMTPGDLTRLGETYIERSRDYRTGDKPRFIDKMNSNWFRVGLIRLMLPNARIIDLRRDALDCCWSNFKMMFAEGTVAANDQRAIARFYRDYVRMVDAVDAAAPGGILKVRYEELVDDVEGQTRRILDFLGLDYEPACIDFHLSTSAVATPSSEQVRRPVNRDSIGSSAPYRQWLGPMIEELGELANQ